MPNVNTQEKVAIPPEKPVQDPNKDFSARLKAFFQNSVVDNLKKIRKNSEMKSGDKKPAYEGQQTEKLYDVKVLTSNITPKKLVKLLGLLLTIVMIFAALYVRFIMKTPIRRISTIVNIPAPTYSPFQKYKPSIYAQDANFIKIDEGISVLENEIKNTPLEEQTLLPPSLDFNIEFK